MNFPGRSAAAVGLSNAPLVLLSFLQQTPRSSAVDVDFLKELDSLGRELRLTRCDSNCWSGPPTTSNGPSCCWSGPGPTTSNGPCFGLEEDLQTDGHFPCIITGPPGDMQPLVQLERPGANFEEAEARVIAAELREIADQLEHDVVSQATDNLARKLLNSPVNKWKNYLTLEVEWVVKHGLEHLHLRQLPEERVIVALTLTLVRGVCRQTPRLLRGLFDTALHYISHRR